MQFVRSTCRMGTQPLKIMPSDYILFVWNIARGCRHSMSLKGVWNVLCIAVLKCWHVLFILTGGWIAWDSRLSATHLTTRYFDLMKVGVSLSSYLFIINSKGNVQNTGRNAVLVRGLKYTIILDPIHKTLRKYLAWLLLRPYQCLLLLVENADWSLLLGFQTTGVKVTRTTLMAPSPWNRKVLPPRVTPTIGPPPWVPYP